MTEAETHAREVMRQPTRTLRRQALERVPSHLRAKVEALVKAKWRKK